MISAALIFHLSNFHQKQIHTHTHKHTQAYTPQTNLQNSTKIRDMKDNNDGYVRADQIDLKSLDEQLQRHLNKALTLERKRKEEEDEQQELRERGRSSNSRAEWEIDPSLLLVKSVIARGTFGTVHRGVYDGQDVAGFFFFSFFTHSSISSFTWCAIF